MISINVYALLGLVLLMAAIGSFIGCFIYVKIYKWDKIKVHTKLEVSKDALKTLLTLRESQDISKL